MGVLGSRHMMHLFIMHFFGCFGWLCNIAFAQFEISESVTGSANFPAIGIAFLGNLAVFITSLLRGRLDLEMGARDVLATLRGPQLYQINDGFGLTTCEQQAEKRFAKASVVMLSYDPPNSSMKQFMRYICNAYKVHSILLQCFPLKSKSDQLLPGICNCIHDGPEESKCNCIVFWNVEEIVKMLAPRMPGTLKRLSDSLCLLPSPQCLKTGCHGCIQAQLPVEETDESGSKILTEDDIKKGKKAVKEIFEYISGGAMKGAHPCICIPLSPSGYDYWTKLLTRSFGATGEANRDYSTASLLLPRLTEVLLNLVLTVWFRVDGFSSSLVARRAIKDYVVDSKGSGFAAGAFLIKAWTNPNYECRVLNFRGTALGIRTFSYIVGSVNLICSIIWTVLVALQGSRIGKWYDAYSLQPSKYRVVVIIITIGIALGMDCMHLYLRSISKNPTVKNDSKEDRSSDAKEPTVKIDSTEPTSTEPTFKVWILLKAWFRPIFKVWNLLKAWFRPILQVWLRLKPWLHPIVQVWLRLKPWLLPIVQVWHRLKPWLLSIVQVWHRLKAWFHRIVQAWFRGYLKKVLLRQKVMVCAVIALEMVCILSGSMLLAILGPKCFGRWLYSALQILVWVKWGIGSYLLGEYPPEYDSESKEENGITVYYSSFLYDNGILVYSSAFLLNAILAGVRAHWQYQVYCTSHNPCND